MQDLSIILMASQKDTLIEALTYILAVVPDYRELIVGLAPNLPARTRRYIESRPRVKILPGTDNIDEAGEVRFRLLDECQGEWILNCDDDDLLVYVPSLDNIAKDVGYIFGDTVFLAAKTAGPFQAGHCQLMQGKPIRRPEDAGNAAGSAWLLRREAWECVSPLIDRSIWWFSDFRILFWLLKLGWKVEHIPRLMGIVRILKWNYPGGDEWMWSNFVKRMEAQYEAQPGLRQGCPSGLDQR